MRSIQLCIFTFRKQDLIEKFPILYRNENNPNQKRVDVEGLDTRA